MIIQKSISLLKKIVAIFILILTNLKLYKPTIAGTVTFEGAPIEGAVVTLYLPDKVTEVNSILSDPSGKYSMEAPAGNYYLTAVYKYPDTHKIHKEQDVTIPSTSITVDLSLE